MLAAEGLVSQLNGCDTHRRLWAAPILEAVRQKSSDDGHLGSAKSKMNKRPVWGKP